MKKFLFYPNIKSFLSIEIELKTKLVENCFVAAPYSSDISIDLVLFNELISEANACVQNSVFVFADSVLYLEFIEYHFGKATHPNTLMNVWLLTNATHLNTVQVLSPDRLWEDLCTNSVLAMARVLPLGFDILDRCCFLVSQNKDITLSWAQKNSLVEKGYVYIDRPNSFSELLGFPEKSGLNFFELWQNFVPNPESQALVYIRNGFRPKQIYALPLDEKFDENIQQIEVYRSGIVSPYAFNKSQLKFAEQLANNPQLLHDFNRIISRNKQQVAYNIAFNSDDHAVVCIHDNQRIEIRLEKTSFSVYKVFFTHSFRLKLTEAELKVGMFLQEYNSLPRSRVEEPKFDFVNIVSRIKKRFYDELHDSADLYIIQKDSKDAYHIKCRMG
jgi:hypothetical protein